MEFTSGATPGIVLVRGIVAGASDDNVQLAPPNASMMTVTPVPCGAVYIAV